VKGLEKLKLRERGAGVVIPVKVVPGSSRDKIVGVLGDMLKIATSAAAQKGKANAAAGRMLARALGLDKRAVELIKGATSQHKEFRVVGLTPAEIRGRLCDREDIP
jgi:uncharacterized protein (TIGR00251 family)